MNDRKFQFWKMRPGLSGTHPENEWEMKWVFGIVGAEDG